MSKRPKSDMIGASDVDGAKKIILHEKAFAHLTRGMYRSPASAVRELISNAWDAGAHNVQIRTGYPHFVEMTITDDGDGFNRDEFLRIVEGGLGNSEKRIRESSSPSDRPIIGRLGIGMFGIAQICGSFLISSNPKVGQPFKARIRLYNLIKEELDKPETPYVQTSETDASLEIHVGDWRELPFDPDEFDGTGTRIVADVMHPVFSKTFRDSIQKEDGVPPRKWKDAVIKLSEHHSLQELGEYFRFIWEISASVPVPYLDATAVPRNAVKKFHQNLVKQKFKVYVDGIQLFKPVWLKGNYNGYTVVQIPETTETPFNRRISFSGYIAVQEGSQIQPDELRGIMVRVKGVGIGLYDPSLLDYRFNEGPRTRWITGEVYVTEGLEDALNVDRDSFNRFHPQFAYLQKAVHEILQTILFPKVYTRLDARSKRKARQRDQARSVALIDTLSEVFGADARGSIADDSQLKIRSIKIGNEKRVINLQADHAVDTKKSNRQLARSLLVLLDLAMFHPRDKIRQFFADALIKLLKRW
jgi:hypothetical protein